MERAEWLKKMRTQAEALYDHIAPAYWVTFGVQPDPVHRQFIGKLLGKLQPHGTILDAGCGAGRYDGMLVEAGQRVLGIDQSGSMLGRARERFPEQSFPTLHYEKIGLQEMDFDAEFDGALCMEAMEHISPEDWPGILRGFQRALKLGGWLLLALDMPDWEDVRASYEQSKVMGLPLVYGEVVDRVDSAFERVKSLDPAVVPGETADPAVYHFYPAPEQVRAWLRDAGFAIEDEGCGDGYEHLLLRRL